MLTDVLTPLGSDWEPFKCPKFQGNQTPAEESPKASRSVAAASVCPLTAAGRLVGLSKNATYRGVKAGQIPALKIGGRLIVLKTEWLKMIGANIGTDDAA